MHRFRLQFDGDRPDEYITAESSVEAANLRDGGPESRPPHTITDETAMASWLDGRADRIAADPHPLALRRATR